jgi:hypothetical protein
VFKILLVGCGEITRCFERLFFIAVHRASKFMFNEIDDDGVETLLAATLKIRLRLFFSETGDERPGCISLDEVRTAALGH